MIRDLLFFCPVCRQPDTIDAHIKPRCSSCGSYFARVGRHIVINSETRLSYQWFEQIKNLPFPPPIRHDIPLRPGELLLFRSQDTALRQFTTSQVWNPEQGQFAVLELPVTLATIQLAATDHRIFFISKNKVIDYPLDIITCITTDANTFLFKLRGQHCYQLLFSSESPLKYEVWLRRVVMEFWRTKYRREIVEYQPKIVFKDKRLRKKMPVIKIQPQPPTERPLKQKVIYHILHFAFAMFFKLFLRARVYGQENMPREGAAIVVLNHEGYWDAFLAQSMLPRQIALLAKNTEFKNPVFRYVLKVARSIPVRRYQIDPSSVRNALKRLAQGELVGIFIEGERSWDGRFLPPKRGTIKLLIKANVPIVPVRIRGSFDVMPRWANKIQLYPVTFHIGKPIVLNRRNRTIERTSQEVMDVLAKLGARINGNIDAGNNES